MRRGLQISVVVEDISMYLALRRPLFSEVTLNSWTWHQKTWLLDVRGVFFQRTIFSGSSDMEPLIQEHADAGWPMMGLYDGSIAVKKTC